MLGDNCELCGLFKGCLHPFMNGSGPANPRILLIGEGPGRNEDEQNEPFVGEAGKKLRKALEAAGLKPGDFGLTNVVRCRPPKNRTPKAKEIKYCSEFLLKEIEERNPKVVVLLGDTALKAVLGQSGITQYNGVVAQRGSMIYVPAYHPSYFNYGNMDKLGDWLKALDTAVELAFGETFRPGDAHIKYHFPGSYEELQEMMDLLWADEFISYDVESVWLDEFKPGNAILSVSFGCKGHAWSFPLYHRDAEAYWKMGNVDVETVVNDFVRPLLTEHNIIGHNVRFDCKQTRQLLGIEFQPWGCTMRISQFINSKPGIHGLKRLAGVHLGMFDYDAELERYKRLHPDCDYDKGGNYGNIPLPELLPYGGKDAAANRMLYDVLEPMMTEAQRTMYEELMMGADYMLGRMESAGMMLDKDLAARYYHIYSIIQGEYEEQILQDPDVQAYIADKQRVLDKDWKLRQAKSKRALKRPVYDFNPNSSDQMAEVWYTYKGYEPVGETDSGKRSIQMKKLKLRDDITEDPLFEPYRIWKLLGSMLSKYLGPAMKVGEVWDTGDGRVRSNFNIGGAETGRLSSSEPNMQNIPTPEKEPGTLLATLPIKNLFRATFLPKPKYDLPHVPIRMPLDEYIEAVIKGDVGTLCCADYSSMELRVMASVSGCNSMMQVFADGLDPHCFVTRMVYPDIVGDADDKTIKKQFRDYRYKAKWTNWTLLYLGSAYTLYNLYKIPIDEAEYIIKTYYEKFPEILNYQQDTIEFAKLNGFVENPFGRRMYLPDINSPEEGKAAKATRTAVNMPIQGAASDVLLCAATIIDIKMREAGLKSRLVNTVHDSLVGDVYPGELPVYASLCRDVMVNVIDYAHEFMPRMDFSWLRVPLGVDLEIGSHYGSLVELDEEVLYAVH